MAAAAAPRPVPLGTLHRRRLKEAVYKAISRDAPSVGFKQVRLGPAADGGCGVAVDADVLAGGAVEAAWRVVSAAGEDFFLSTAVYRR